MNGFDWQVAAALAIVALAIAALGRRLLQLVRGNSKGGCGTGGCGSCATEAASGNGEARQLPLVTLDRRGETDRAAYETTHGR